MDKKRIEQLRRLINKMLSSENYDYNKLLVKSQELDKLLVEAVKESMCEDRVLKEGKNSRTGRKNKFVNIIDEIEVFKD